MSGLPAATLDWGLPAVDLLAALADCSTYYLGNTAKQTYQLKAL